MHDAAIDESADVFTCEGTDLAAEARRMTSGQLRQLGVRLAIDDFGSEYSSFDYVRAYRVNHLKIAQSFVSRSTSDPECAATIRAIVNFARDVGIGVIAQGVETEQQRDLLTSTDITTQAQGFHFSKAVSAERAGDLLRQGRISSVQELPDGDFLRSQRRLSSL